MHEYIYEDGGMYYRELTDIVGISIFKERISEEEYNRIKRKVKDDN
jgi:hypothetical protein